MINVICPSRYKVSRSNIKTFASEALDQYKIPENFTLNVIYVGKNKMRSIAREYKQEDIALPVLSFRYDKTETGNDEFLGEVIICFPQAVLLAAERSKTVNQIHQFLIEHAIDNIMTK